MYSRPYFSQMICKSVVSQLNVALFVVNIHIFYYPDPPLSILFLVPTSPDNQGSTEPLPSDCFFWVVPLGVCPLKDYKT